MTDNPSKVRVRYTGGTLMSGPFYCLYFRQGVSEPVDRVLAEAAVKTAPNLLAIISAEEALPEEEQPESRPPRATLELNQDALEDQDAEDLAKVRATYEAARTEELEEGPPPAPPGELSTCSGISPSPPAPGGCNLKELSVTSGREQEAIGEVVGGDPLPTPSLPPERAAGGRPDLAQKEREELPQAGDPQEPDSPAAPAAAPGPAPSSGPGPAKKMPPGRSGPRR